MDIKIFRTLENVLAGGLAAKANEIGYTLKVVTRYPKNPKFPFVYFNEIQNRPKTDERNFRERFAGLGYQVSVFVTEAPAVDVRDTARSIAHHCNDILTCAGLRRVSMNEFDMNPYEVRVIYQATFHENKERIY